MSQISKHKHYAIAVPCYLRITVSWIVHYMACNCLDSDTDHCSTLTACAVEHHHNQALSMLSVQTGPFLPCLPSSQGVGAVVMKNLHKIWHSTGSTRYQAGLTTSNRDTALQ